MEVDLKDTRVRIVINGEEVACSHEETVLAVAQRAGIYIPTLCHDDRLEPYGGCRLCLVEIEGASRPQPACTTHVTDGMEVRTESKTLRRIRKNLVSLLLSNHPNDCMTCENAGGCTLQELAYEYGVDGSRFAGERWDLPIREDNPFITYEPNKCVLCGRCTRICNEVVMAGTINLVGKGFDSMPDTAFKKPRSLDNCEFCGQCVSTCPTGALTDKAARCKGRSTQLKKVRTTCSYCGTGCNFYLNVRDGKVVKVTSAYDAPVNRGNLCIKGRYGYDFIHSPDRIRTPLIKKDGVFHEATWDEALDLVASKFKGLVEKYGPEKVGGFSSSRCTNEENYLLSKWVRCAIGSNNVDNCARV